MLRLQPFEVAQPESVEEAVALLAAASEAGRHAKLIAGGTDLVPNMKHGIEQPDALISLGRLGLRSIEDRGDHMRFGAMVPVDTLARHEAVNAIYPALAEACALIAGPQLRRMGTLGGNICLDTRCLFINQTHFWREALGYCLKKDGEVCHVVKKGQRCVAAASNDSVPPLMLYGALLNIAGPKGNRQVSLEDFFVQDGVYNKKLHSDELLTSIDVPKPPAGTQVGYEKLRTRKDIDFPLLSLAIRVDRDGDACTGASAILSAMGSKPKRVNLDKVLAGVRLEAETIDAAAAKVHQATKPLTNLATDPLWRKAMGRVMARRLLRRLAQG